MGQSKQLDGLKFSTYMLLVVAAGLFIFAGWLWCTKIYMSNQRVFWSAIDNALATRSVHRVSNYSSGGEIQENSTTIQYSPVIAALGVNRVEDSFGRSTITEIRSLPEADFAVYTSLVDPEAPQLKSMEGVWTRVSSDDANTIRSQRSNIITGGGLIFTGNLTKENRDSLVDFMKQAKTYDTVVVSGKKQFGNKTATIYKVQLNTTGYSQALARYLHMMGFPDAAEQVNELSPGSQNQQFIIEVAIEPRTRTILAAGFPEIGQPGTETFSMWGAHRSIEPPKDYLSNDEFQTKLESSYPAGAN